MRKSERIKVGLGLISRMNIPQTTLKEIKSIGDLIHDIREITPKKVFPYISVSEKAYNILKEKGLIDN